MLANLSMDQIEEATTATKKSDANFLISDEKLLQLSEATDEEMTELELSRFLVYLLRSRIDFLETRLMETMTVNDTELTFNTAVDDGMGQVDGA